MIQFYKNIFYHIYRWKKKDKSEENPEFIAVLIMSTILSANIITILSLIAYFDDSFIEILKPNRLHYYPSLLIVLIINYLMLVYKGRYKKILFEYENKELIYKIKKRTLFILSFIITILFFVVVMLLFYIRNEF